MNIPKLSVKNPVLVNMVMVIIMILGVYQTMTMPKEAMPAVDMGKFVITISYPGVSSEEIESLIVDKIEEELSDITEIDYIQSTAYEGRATIMVNLNADADIDDAWDEVSKELDKVKDLPEDATDPYMQNISTKEMKSVCTIAIEGDYTPYNMKKIVEDIKDDLININYISKIELKGAKEREIHIKLDRTKAENYGILFSDVENSIKAANIKLPGGTLKSGAADILLKTDAEFDEVAKIAYLPIKNDGKGGLLRIKDVADVTDTYHETNVITRLDGSESINLYVYQSLDGNIVDIIAAIRKYLDTVPERFADVNVKIINDESIKVSNNINTLSSSAVLGMILVFISLLVFLGWRNAVLAAMGIPFTFMMTFFMMDYFDMTINNLSLFALVLVLGMVVDDAIVVIENVHRNIEEGMDVKSAAIEGTREVMWPVFAAVATTISAFLPLLMMEGNMGKFLSVFPKVVALALIASLFEALFILPSHLADFSKVSKKKKLENQGKNEKKTLYYKILDAYEKVLISFLNKRTIVMIGVVFALLLSGLAVVKGLVKVEFFPKSTPSTLIVKVETPQGTVIEQTDKIAKEIEAFFLQLPYKEDIKAVNSNIGQMQEGRNWEESSNFMEFRIDLVDADDMQYAVEDIKQTIREYLAKREELVAYRFATADGGPPTGNDIELRISGDNLEELEKHGQYLKSVLAEIPGVSDIADSFSAGKDEIKIIPDYDKLIFYGISASEVATTVRTAYNGKDVSTFREDNEEFDIVVSYQDKQVDDLAVLRELKIRSKTGKSIALKDLCSFVKGTSLSYIERRDKKRTIEITASTGAYEEDGVTKILSPNDANAILFGNKMQNISGKLTSFNKDNPGYTLTVGGSADEQKKSFGSLYVAFLIAIILIYTILGTQFKSYIQPFIVMITIPFAIIGVIIGLIVSNTAFSLLSLISVIALAGIVVNDSLVLVDFVNKQRAKGGDRWNSLIDAGRTRMRPIFLTTITTIFGLVPMIASTSESVAMWKPMAVSIAYGLAFATILTLLVIPVLYSIIDSFALKVQGKYGITLKEALELRKERNK